ncbi:MAG: flagellar hook assembly protein FlgD [Pseudomonadota bacterium]|jgi:flagellar basal-body rod modification protein FlgD
MDAVKSSTAGSALQSLTGGTSTSDTQKAAEAQDRFLKLLVTQMRNQDPLNPLDNAQVTSQLAQLSTVSGIDKLNTTVEGLQSSYQASQALQSTSLIGRGVLVPGNSVTLANSQAVLGVEMTEPADNVKVVIRDAGKRVLHTVDLGPQDIGTQPLAWDGKDDAGNKVADGKYTMEVVAVRGGVAVAGANPLAFGQVGSVSTGAQGVKINVQGLGALDFASVKQVL